MADTQYMFYECENPDCGLRFPGCEGLPKGNRCPVCRSTIHVVAYMEESRNKSKQFTFHEKWHVDALLDNIRSAWNVGSIFRTSDGTGIHKIFLCGISPTPENLKVSKTALGAEVSIPWEYSNNGVKIASYLKSQGCKLLALEDLPNAAPLYQVDLSGGDFPLVLIVGNEICGVDPGIIELCDKVISIPMVGKKSSYNVATAFGIAASFLLYRQSVFQGSLNIFPSI
jgi:23S rRNA (guanosine2251-2'-O)-methyltransferase